jgi:ParB family chromosome partitioning protein
VHQEPKFQAADALQPPFYCSKFRKKNTEHSDFHKYSIFNLQYSFNKMPLAAIDSAQFQMVPLDRIDLQIDTFRITTREDVDALAVSIQQDGLITVPTLIQKPASAYAVVSGFRRIHACQNLGLHGILARILDSDADPLACLRLAIAENALQRQLNLIETSRAIQKLSSFFDSAVQMAETAATLGLPANLSILNKIKDLCLLPRPVQQSILNDVISLSMAHELGKLDPTSAIAFVRLFEQLKFSLNKQKEILTMVDEIARRENSSVGQVMQDSRLQGIIDSEDFDRAQKGRRIRALLRQRRFPRIFEAEKKYQNHHRQLRLGSDIKLIPPKDFEGTTYTLNLNFTNLEHLVELRKRLDELIVHPSLAKIIED